jgi:hypothetical protein
MASKKRAPVGAPIFYCFFCTSDSAIKFKSIMRLDFVSLAHLPDVLTINAGSQLNIHRKRYTALIILTDGGTLAKHFRALSLTAGCESPVSRIRLE